MQLSQNFSLSEFLFSQTAINHGIDMMPSEEVTDNLQTLVTNILQPLRDYIGAPIRVTSGYRPFKLNTLVKGSKNSAHQYGRAADIVVPSQSAEIVTGAIYEHFMYRCDQVINEYDQWVHIGIAQKPRMEAWKAIKQHGRTAYLPLFDDLPTAA